MDVSGKVDPKQVAVYRELSDATTALGLSYVVVGAAARDLVLHYAYGANIARATTDIDFGIQVSDAASYDGLLRRLEKVGYERAPESQRVTSPEGVDVDVVPFGAIADIDGNVLLPPDCTHQLNVIGFQEACDWADRVRIHANPELVIPVASPPGMALLKLIAWTERTSDARRKDASDLAYLLNTYGEIKAVREEIFNDLRMLECHDGDTKLIAAYRLGQATSRIASDEARRILHEQFGNQRHDSKLDKLVHDMLTNHLDDVRAERNFTLLDMFFKGLRERGSW